MLRTRTAASRYRIAFLGGRGVGHHYSGIETFYEEVGSRLAARGHEVTVYCRPHFAPAEPEYRGMRIRRLPAPRSKHFETLVHSFLAALHGAMHRFDIIHIHAIGSAVFAGIPRMAGCSTVVTVHARDWQRAKWNALARVCLRGAEWASVRLPHRTTAVSETVAEELRSRYGTTLDAIPNGVSPQQPGTTDILERLDLEPRRYILFVGRISKEKGCHDLLDAFQRVAPPGVRLILAGGATYDSEYAARLESLAGPRICFAGWVDASGLADLYANCAVFVLPSSIEGLSLALLEAMSHGAPILASDIPTNVEALGGTGWHFRTGDAGDLARRLSELLARPAALLAAGSQAKARALECYSWERVVDRFERVYGSVLSRRRAAGLAGAGT